MLETLSRKRLAGVHPDLVRVLERAASDPDCPPFRVTEGLRTAARQRQLRAEGKSWTLNSRHLTGHAVDLVAMPSPTAVSYADAEMEPLAEAILAAAEAEGVHVTWGGSWRGGKRDTPHFELSWADYPLGRPRSPAEDDAAPQPAPAPVEVATAADLKPLAASAQVQAGIGEGMAGVALKGLTLSEWMAEAKAAGGMLPALSANPLLAILLGVSVGMICFGAFQVWERRRKRRTYGV